MRILAVLLFCSLTLTGCGEDRASNSPQPGATGPLEVGLRIGNLAPEIEGADLEEIPFKLSDYRGNVVVLDFWGDW